MSSKVCACIHLVRMFVYVACFNAQERFLTQYFMQTATTSKKKRCVLTNKIGSVRDMNKIGLNTFVKGIKLN